MKTVDSGAPPVARAAWTMQILLEQGEISSAEVARRTGVSRRSAQRMLNGMSQTVAIYNDCGVWRLLNR